jgi:TatD DNase family protein
LLVAWAVGCHPADARACADFDGTLFGRALRTAGVVGEVGLDGRSPVPIDRQVAIFTAILGQLAEHPRPVSVHSAGRIGQVLELLAARPVPGVILHWWRGTLEQTRRATELDCFFSVNGAEVAHPRVLEVVPADRILTETDFPFSRRSDPQASAPGRVSAVENMLVRRWQTDVVGVRQHLWRNFARLLRECALPTMMPLGFQRLVALLDERQGE